MKLQSIKLFFSVSLSIVFSVLSAPESVFSVFFQLLKCLVDTGCRQSACSADNYGCKNVFSGNYRRNRIKRNNCEYNAQSHGDQGNESFKLFISVYGLIYNCDDALDDNDDRRNAYHSKYSSIFSSQLLVICILYEK